MVYWVSVDSGSEYEPNPRRFNSLHAAVLYMNRMHHDWRKFAWLYQYEGDKVTVLFKDGQPYKES